MLAFDAVPSASAGTLADPFVFGPVDGWYYVGYSGGPGSGQQGDSQSVPWNISMARTQDFMTFAKLGNIFTRGATVSWDDLNAHRGAVTLAADTYYLPYFGMNATGGYWGIAYMAALSTARGYDPMSVFDFYDDFSDSNLTRWGQPTGEGGTHSVSGGILTMTSGGGTYSTLVGSREFGAGYLAEWRSASRNFDSAANYAGEGGLALDDRSQILRLMSYDTPYWRMGIGTGLYNMSELVDTAMHRHLVAFASATTAAFLNDSGSLQAVVGGPMPVVSVKPWLFSWASDNHNMTMDVDYYLVRKYTNPEPSLSAAGLENAPSWSPRSFTTGLLAHWRMDETSGSTVSDATGTHPGTASNTTIVTGKIGHARSFNGSNSKIGIDAAVNYTGSTFAIAAWVKPSSLKDFNTIFHKEGQYTLSINAQGKVSYADSSTWSYANFGWYGSAGASAWHYVAVVRDGPIVTVYVDGVPLMNKPFGLSIASTAQPEIIGCYATGTCSTYSFNGAIDEVAMWSKALTGAEISYLYNNGSGRPF